MDLKEAIYTRRSVREFTADPVGENVIRDLIDAAIQAPSAVNAQPYMFCVVRDKTALATISREAKAHMVKTTPVGLMSHHFSEILNDAKFDIFYHAPVLILISTEADDPVGGRRLRACRGKSDACRARRRARHMLDRICPGLAGDARGQGAIEAAGGVQAGSADHRRASQIAASAGAEKRAGNPLGRRVRHDAPAVCRPRRHERAALSQGLPIAGAGAGGAVDDRAQRGAPTSWPCPGT